MPDEAHEDVVGENTGLCLRQQLTQLKQLILLHHTFRVEIDQLRLSRRKKNPDPTKKPGLFKRRSLQKKYRIFLHKCYVCQLQQYLSKELFTDFKFWDHGTVSSSGMLYFEPVIPVAAMTDFML